MPHSTNVLITGCARGIGRALASAYLSRPKHTVIAAVRDPASTTSQSLYELPHGENSIIIVAKIDNACETDPSDAIASLKTQHGIDRLDIVIANAGISDYFGPATITPARQMTNHYQINVVGPLLLFQAVAPLLLLSSSAHQPEETQPKFITMSSGAGSITGIEQLKVENTAYGSSKAALNFVTRRIHAENEWLVAFPINPGWLQTELGNHAATSSGMSQAPVSIEEGVTGIIGIIDGATRETASGRFMSATGGELSW